MLVVSCLSDLFSTCSPPVRTGEGAPVSTTCLALAAPHLQGRNPAVAGWGDSGHAEQRFVPGGTGGATGKQDTGFGRPYGTSPGCGPRFPTLTRGAWIAVSLRDGTGNGLPESLIGREHGLSWLTPWPAHAPHSLFWRLMVGFGGIIAGLTVKKVVVVTELPPGEQPLLQQGAAF